MLGASKTRIENALAGERHLKTVVRGTLQWHRKPVSARALTATKLTYLL